MQSSTSRVALAASTALWAVAAAPAALAQEEAIQVGAVSGAVLVEPVSITATRSEKKLDEAPATVSVISSEQIEDQLATDIKDLVRFEPGVAVRNSPARFTAAGSSAGRDGNSGFNIRGIEGNRVLILMDGVRLPDSYSFGAQSVGRGDYLDLGAVKSVEILRGPASALYGSDGVAGAVSFVTKDPADYLAAGKDAGLQGRVGYNSADESWSKTAVAAGRQGPWSAVVSYTRRDGSEQGNKGSNTAANATRTAPNPQDVWSDAVMGKLVFEPSDNNRLRLTYDHLDHKMTADVLSAVAAPPLASTSAIGLTAEDSTRRDRLSLDQRLITGGGPIDRVDWTVYWQQAETLQYSAEDRYTAADRTRIGAFDTQVAGAALQLTSGFDTGGVGHTLIWGGDGSVTRQEGLRDGTVPPVGETFPTRAFPTTDYTLLGAFVQDEIALFDGRLTAYPALRYDYYKLDPDKSDPLFTALTPVTQSDARVSPKIGLVWKATPLLGVFVNYGAGFKPPSPDQVNNGFSNVVSNYRSVSNPNLKPETSTTLEGGLRARTDRWAASATVFSGRYRNFISQVQTGGNFTAANPAIYQYVNLGRVSISGVEVKGQADLGAGFTLDVAGAYARGTSTANGVKTPVDSIEPLKVVAGLGWRDGQGRYGGQLIATYSAGKEASRAGGSCGANCFTPPAFTILDATAFWNATPQATFRAGVFNITDEKYWWWSDVRGQLKTSTVLDAYTQPGRNFALSLTVKL